MTGFHLMQTNCRLHDGALDDARHLLPDVFGPPRHEHSKSWSSLDRGIRIPHRLATKSPFYARRLAAAQVEPGKLDVAGLRAIPVTTKRDLIEQPSDFRCTDVAGFLATRTAGTTGRPAEVWLSRYEMELWPALGALSSVLRDELRPSDIMQVNVSSRATAATHLAAASCRPGRRRMPGRLASCRRTRR